MACCIHRSWLNVRPHKFITLAIGSRTTSIYAERQWTKGTMHVLGLNTRYRDMASKAWYPQADDETETRESISREEEGEQREKQRIHIIGTGSIGKFIAHSLFSAPGAPPISLIFHRPSYVSGLRNQQCSITLHANNNPTTVGPFDVELALQHNKRESEPDAAASGRDEFLQRYGNLISDEPIRSLILTVKAHHTISALKSIKHRLSPDSTILFLQNGMGTVDDVNEQLWPNEADRPNYLVGVNSHGVYARDTFEAVHAGQGVIYLGALPRSSARLGEDKASSEQANATEKEPEGLILSETTRQLLRLFTRIPVLSAVPLSASKLLDRQLEKLAVNCIINPLTVFLDARNGAILHNFAMTRVMRLLLSEIGLVFQAMPEIRANPSAHILFSPSRLETQAVRVANKTAENISSMLQDIRRGQETEIEYINGYVVKRGEEQGIKPVMNYMLMNMVKAKQAMISKEQAGWVPQRVSMSPGRSKAKM